MALSIDSKAPVETLQEYLPLLASILVYFTVKELTVCSASTWPSFKKVKLVTLGDVVTQVNVTVCPSIGLFGWNSSVGWSGFAEKKDISNQSRGIKLFL